MIVDNDHYANFKSVYDTEKGYDYRKQSKVKLLLYTLP